MEYFLLCGPLQPPKEKFFIAREMDFWYNVFVMEKLTRIYVSVKNPLTWLSALCMVSSAVARILVVGMKGADLWCQILLPVIASLLFALMILTTGKERFYKTAIPVWMICIYFFLVFEAVDFAPMDLMVTLLYAIVMVFVAVMYKQITSEKTNRVWLLIPITVFPLAAIVYLNRNPLMAGQFVQLLQGEDLVEGLGYYRAFLADGLMTVGIVLALCATRHFPVGEYHPTWGDRTDGRRIRTEPPMNQVSPYIMVTRNTSTNYFTEAFEITQVERYIRQKRREGLTNFGLTHVLLACYCRAAAKYPKINRFIAGQKIYSHGNDLQFCMTIKKEMTSDSPETLIKVHLTPYDTAEDVYRKMNKEVEKVKSTPLDSDFDNTAQALTMIPGVVLKFTVWLLRTLDYFGLLPRFLLEVSPFHGSVFFTSMGSLGIPPIYHHLYDFGNLPLFGSFGCKRRALEIQEDGTVVQRKYLDCKFTMDERIVDGFYYAAFFKHYRRLLSRPETLDNPPEEVLKDID